MRIKTIPLQRKIPIRTVEIITIWKDTTAPVGHKINDEMLASETNTTYWYYNIYKVV